MIRRLLPLLLILVIACGRGYAENPACPLSVEKQALTEADTFRSWDALYRSFASYQKCDDGAIAEGYSESVARILVDHWNTLPKLAELATKNHEFLRFVERHIDATNDEKDLQKIKAEAKTNCPTGLRKTCDDLSKEADSALKETASSR